MSGRADALEAPERCPACRAQIRDAQGRAGLALAQFSAVVARPKGRRHADRRRNRDRALLRFMHTHNRTVRLRVRPCPTCGACERELPPTVVRR